MWDEMVKGRRKLRYQESIVKDGVRGSERGNHWERRSESKNEGTTQGRFCVKIDMVINPFLSVFGQITF